MSATTATFVLFPDLPPELRRMIWKECLPKHRVLELDYASVLIDEFRCHRSHWSTKENFRPPVITRVCHESRMIAFETGHVCGPDGDYLTDWGLCYPRSTQWCDPTTDIVVMHWSPSIFADPEYGYPDPTPWLLKYAPMCQGALIMADWVCRWDNKRTFDFSYPLLSSLNNWTICLQAVMIHITKAEIMTSNLFGILGEEVTQVVNASDTCTLEKFAQLSLRSSGSEIPTIRTFFEEVMDSDAFQALVKRWTEDCVSMWVWYHWTVELQTNLRGICRAEEVWLHRHPRTQDDAGFTFDILDVRNLTTLGLITDHIDLDRFIPNRQHPWVKQIVTQMPTFRPAFVFRPCPMECWRPVTPPTERRNGRLVLIDEPGPTNGH